MDRLPAIVEPAVARLRELEPTAVAVLVGGSYARGTADELSDLDLTAIVERDDGRYLTWFQDRPAMRPLHVSAGVKTIDERLSRRSEPASWWLGLPQLEPAVYAWATDDARTRLGEDPSLRRPAGPPELEDFFEFSMKVRRAIETGDSLGLRVYAMSAAELAPRLLLPLNEPVFVSSRREAAEAALAFAVAPAHYAEDLRLCLGLVQTHDAALGTAALRLARELLAFLREHKPDIDPLPDLIRCLTEGTLERQLASQDASVRLMLKITVGSFELSARLEEERAPNTVAAFRRLLPLDSQLIQARWSGQAAWIPFGELDLGIGFEGPTSYPGPGELLIYPGGVSETEILFPYGQTCFASKAGQLAGNHFATVVDGREHLEEIGRLVLWEGAQDIHFEED